MVYQCSHKAGKPDSASAVRLVLQAQMSACWVILPGTPMYATTLVPAAHGGRSLVFLQLILGCWSVILAFLPLSFVIGLNALTREPMTPSTDRAGPGTDL